MGNRGRQFLFLTLLLALLSGAIGPGCRRGNAGSAEKKAAPGFSLKSLNGKTIRLSDYRGKVVILDFWAIRCPPCRMQIPILVKLFQKYSHQGVMILGISVDRDQGLNQFTKKNNINYPILLPDGKVDKDYGGIQYIPTLFIIDPAGKIYKKYLGAQPLNTLERDIQTLLKIK